MGCGGRTRRTERMMCCRCAWYRTGMSSIARGTQRWTLRLRERVRRGRRAPRCASVGRWWSLAVWRACKDARSLPPTLAQAVSRVPALRSGCVRGPCFLVTDEVTCSMSHGHAGRARRHGHTSFLILPLPLVSSLLVSQTRSFFPGHHSHSSLRLTKKYKDTQRHNGASTLVQLAVFPVPSAQPEDHRLLPPHEQLSAAAVVVPAIDPVLEPNTAAKCEPGHSWPIV